MMKRPAVYLVMSAALLSGCIGPPPNPYAVGIRRPPSLNTAPPVLPSASTDDTSMSDMAAPVIIGALAGAGGGYGLSKLGAAKPAPALTTPLAEPLPKAAMGIAEGDGAAAAAAAARTAEERAAPGLLARLRANSALRFIAGVGGEETGIAATAAGGITRFVFRGLVIPAAGALILYEFLKE